MAITSGVRVRLEPWEEGDLWLLRRKNEPEMTDFLGGPEPEEALLARHERYCAISDPRVGQMFRVVLAGQGSDEVVGSVGYWERTWQGEAVYETGWAVLPEFQGRGIAVAAVRAVLDTARAVGGNRSVHAYPKVVHAASNAVARKAGFELVGECDFEYPKGVPIRCNDWRFDLRQQSLRRS